MTALPAVFAAVEMPPRITLEDFDRARHRSGIADTRLDVDVAFKLLYHNAVGVPERVANEVTRFDALLHGG